MSSVFGEVRQIGFMSRDIDRSMQYFADAWGVGPWYILRHLPAAMLYHGEAIDLDISIAMANCGDLQFEIVMQHNDEVRSLYTDSLAHTPQLHIQHFAVWKDDVRATEAEAHARGWQSIFETNSGPGKSIFIAHPDEPAVCLELSDCDPFKDAVRDAIKQIASTWDGSDPVREGLPSQ
jgi:hypothetical protein